MFANLLRKIFPWANAPALDAEEEPRLLYESYLDTEMNIFYLGNDQRWSFPVRADDAAEWDKFIENIQRHLRTWMIQDQAFAANGNQSVTSTLCYNLKEIDLKYVPYPSYFLKLQECLRDTEINNSGNRLMDTFVRIYLHSDPYLLEVLQGRFLHGVLCALSPTINDRPLPNANQWADCLEQLPWLPLVVFIQDMYENDEIYSEVLQHVGQNRPAATAATDVRTSSQVPQQRRRAPRASGS